jgi:hypothetical protein
MRDYKQNEANSGKFQWLMAEGGVSENMRTNECLNLKSHLMVLARLLLVGVRILQVHFRLAHQGRR